MNKLAAGVNAFHRNPDSALSFIDSAPSYLEDEDGKRRAVSPEEASNLFEAEGARVIDTYAVYGWMDVLRIPKEVRESRNWDESFFGQTTQMVLKLSEEPSVKGMSRHLVLYGEKL